MFNAARLLPNDNMTEVFNAAALLPDVLRVLKAQVWPPPTTRGGTTSGGTLTAI
jgi:hypothetical protein